MCDYDSDFRKAKSGDWAFTINGWQKIADISPTVEYPVKIIGRSHTFDGYFLEDDAFPTIFLQPPACFNAPPKPCSLKKGDRVLVWDDDEEVPRKRYFSHVGADGRFYCFVNGRDEWSSGGGTSDWKNCEKWREPTK